MKVTRELLYRRPGMYIGGSHDGKLSAANLYGNFLRGILRLPNLDDLAYVDFVSSEHCFSVTAYGTVVTLPNNIIAFSDIFDIKNIEQISLLEIDPLVSPALRWFCPIVWYSEYCLVEMATSHGNYRQVFLDGSSLHSPTEVPLSEQNEQVIGFNFTLPANIDVFHELRLDVLRLKLDIRDLKNRLHLWPEFENEKSPKLKLRWSVRSQYCHTLRIEIVPTRYMQ